jgi:hypothetical protein
VCSYVRHLGWPFCNADCASQWCLGRPCGRNGVQFQCGTCLGTGQVQTPPCYHGKTSNHYYCEHNSGRNSTLIFTLLNLKYNKQ